MNKEASISDAELEVLEVLWNSDSAMTAYEIRQYLNKTKRWERTTVLTLIRRLLEKGVISQEKRDVYYYQPEIKKQDYLRKETRNFVGKLYNGSTKDLVAALVLDERLSHEDICELRNFFNQNF